MQEPSSEVHFWTVCIMSGLKTNLNLGWVSEERHRLLRPVCRDLSRAVRQQRALRNLQLQ